jgi:crossover junction endodeoxyribonuclease RusA
MHLSELQQEVSEEFLISLYREVSDPYVVAYFAVDGEPETKARARWNTAKGGRPFTPKQTKQAEERIGWLFRRSAGSFIPDRVSGFGVFASFVAKLNQRRDVDNMLKLVMDALNGLAWVDDSQVTEISAKKRQSSGCDPRTYVVIYRTLSNPHPQASCQGCGRLFDVYPSTKGRKFCSRTCSDQGRRTGDEVVCLHCERAFYRPANKRDVGVVHCSKECRAASAQHRTTKSCVQCGELYSRPQSVAARGGSLCSDDCRVVWAAAHPTQASSGGTCRVCGGKTSHREYSRCGACKAAGLTENGR